MRRKIVTSHADANIDAISLFIAQDNPSASERYYRAVADTFENLPDILTPERASEYLPETVRKMNVKGFGGYTLHIAILEDATYLLSAYRPGLPEAYKIAQTRKALAQRDT